MFLIAWKPSPSQQLRLACLWPGPRKLNAFMETWGTCFIKIFNSLGISCCCCCCCKFKKTKLKTNFGSNNFGFTYLRHHLALILDPRFVDWYFVSVQMWTVVSLSVNVCALAMGYIGDFEPPSVYPGHTAISSESPIGASKGVEMI